MDETTKAVVLLLIGWGLGVLSTLVSNWLQVRQEQRKQQAQRESEIRKRLVGNLIQTSEVMSYVQAARKRGEIPDLRVVSRVIRGPLIHDYSTVTLAHWEAFRSLGIFARLCVREN